MPGVSVSGSLDGNRSRFSTKIWVVPPPLIAPVQTHQELPVSFLRMTSPSSLSEIRCVFPDRIHRNHGRKRGTRSRRRLYSLRGARGTFLVVGFAFQAYKPPHHTSPDTIPSRYPAYRTVPICSKLFYLPGAYGSRRFRSTRHNQQAPDYRPQSSIYQLS